MLWRINELMLCSVDMLFILLISGADVVGSTGDGAVICGTEATDTGLNGDIGCTTGCGAMTGAGRGSTGAEVTGIWNGRMLVEVDGMSMTETGCGAEIGRATEVTGATGATGAIFSSSASLTKIRIAGIVGSKMYLPRPFSSTDIFFGAIIGISSERTCKKKKIDESVMRIRNDANCKEV